MNKIKKILLIFISGALAAPAFAEAINIKSYYPIPFYSLSGGVALHSTSYAVLVEKGGVLEIASGLYGPSESTGITFADAPLTLAPASGHAVRQSSAPAAPIVMGNTSAGIRLRKAYLIIGDMNVRSVRTAALGGGTNDPKPMAYLAGRNAGTLKLGDGIVVPNPALAGGSPASDALSWKTITYKGQTKKFLTLAPGCAVGDPRSTDGRCCTEYPCRQGCPNAQLSQACCETEAHAYWVASNPSGSRCQYCPTRYQAYYRGQCRNRTLRALEVGGVNTPGHGYFMGHFPTWCIENAFVAAPRYYQNTDYTISEMSGSTTSPPYGHCPSACGDSLQEGCVGFYSKKVICPCSRVIDGTGGYTWHERVNENGAIVQGHSNGYNAYNSGNILYCDAAKPDLYCQTGSYMWFN